VKTRCRESFAEDLSAPKDAAWLRRIQRSIEQVEAASSLQHAPNLRRLESQGKPGRIRIGDYRRRFVFENGAVTFVPSLNRKGTYRYFP